MMYQQMALYKIVSDTEDSILVSTEYFQFDQCPARQSRSGYIWQPTLEVFFGPTNPESVSE